MKWRKIEPDAVEMEILCQLKETTQPEGVANIMASNDEDFSYGKAIALTLKRLQPQKKAQAKIKIQQLLYDIEFSQAHPREPLYTHGESASSQPRQESSYIRTSTREYSHDPYSGYGFYQTAAGGHGQNENINL